MAAMIPVNFTLFSCRSSSGLCNTCPETHPRGSQSGLRTPSERSLFVNECYSNFAAASGVKIRHRSTARTFLYSLPIFPVNAEVKHPRRSVTRKVRERLSVFVVEVLEDLVDFCIRSAHEAVDGNGHFQNHFSHVRSSFGLPIKSGVRAAALGLRSAPHMIRRARVPSPSR